MRWNYGHICIRRREWSINVSLNIHTLPLTGIHSSTQTYCWKLTSIHTPVYMSRLCWLDAGVEKFLYPPSSTVLEPRRSVKEIPIKASPYRFNCLTSSCSFLVNEVMSQCAIASTIIVYVCSSSLPKWKLSAISPFVFPDSRLTQSRGYNWRWVLGENVSNWMKRTLFLKPERSFLIQATIDAWWHWWPLLIFTEVSTQFVPSDKPVASNLYGNRGLPREGPAAATFLCEGRCVYCMSRYAAITTPEKKRICFALSLFLTGHIGRYLDPFCLIPPLFFYNHEFHRCGGLFSA